MARNQQSNLFVHSWGPWSQERLRDLTEEEEEVVGRNVLCFLKSQGWVNRRGWAEDKKGPLFPEHSLGWTGLTHSACCNPKWVRLSPTHQRAHWKPDEAEGLSSYRSRQRRLDKEGLWTTTWSLGVFCFRFILVFQSVLSMRSSWYFLRFPSFPSRNRILNWQDAKLITSLAYQILV